MGNVVYMCTEGLSIVQIAFKYMSLIEKKFTTRVDREKAKIFQKGDYKQASPFAVMVYRKDLAMGLLQDLTKGQTFLARREDAGAYDNLSTFNLTGSTKLFAKVRDAGGCKWDF